MGAASIEGMIDVDMTFKLRLLPGVDGKQGPPTRTPIKEIFSMMEHNRKKVLICLSTGTDSMSTGYFTSVVKGIKEHVLAFILCPGAQVFWWLCRMGCIIEDVNCLIRHCLTLSQQQNVTKSKYIKDMGHAMIDQDGDIIHTVTTQGIYDLTLGLSGKERRRLVAGRAHKASAKTFGETKEGVMEAHNFSLQASITTIHAQKEKKQDVTSVVSARTLAKSVV
jgi:hypothetical protein